MWIGRKKWKTLNVKIIDLALKLEAIEQIVRSYEDKLDNIKKAISKHKDKKRSDKIVAHD